MHAAATTTVNVIDFWMAICPDLVCFAIPILEGRRGMQDLRETSGKGGGKLPEDWSNGLFGCREKGSRIEEEAVSRPGSPNLTPS